MNDQTLLEGIANGDESSYKHLFYTYFEPLTFYANRYLQDIDASRDVVQEVMSHIYENRNTLEIRESLKSFLYRMVSNKSLNVIKHEDVKHRHHQIIKSRSDEGLDIDLMEVSELEAKVSRLIDELPTECGRIFKMSRVEQLSNQEIADKLNISKRTVETQISKALKLFKIALKIMLLELFLKNF